LLHQSKNVMNFSDFCFLNFSILKNNNIFICSLSSPFLHFTTQTIEILRKAHRTKKGTFYTHSVAYPSTPPTVFYYSLIVFYSIPSIIFTLSSSYNHNLYICLATILNKVNRKHCRSYNTTFLSFYLFHF